MFARTLPAWCNSQRRRPFRPRDDLDVDATPRIPAGACGCRRGGHAVCARDVLAAAAASAALYDLPRFGNVHFLHFTDCHAQLLPIHFREPSVNLGVGAAPRAAAASGRRASAQALRHCSRGTRDAHAFTHLDFAQAARAYGKLGGFAHLATLVKQLKATPARRAAARRRRYLAGLGHRAVDQRRRTWSTPSKLLGVDVMTGHWEFTYGAEAREGNRREGLQGQDRLRRAERQDRRLRRSGVHALHDARDQRRAGRDHRPGVSVHADREPALLRAGLDASASRTRHAEGRRRSARQGRAGRRAAVAQRHGRRPEAGVARARHRRDPRRPHARRRAAAAPVEQRRRQDARHQRGLQRQVPRRARPRRQGRQGRRLPLPAAAGVLEPAAGRPRDGRAASRRCARRTRAKLDEKLAIDRGTAVPPRQLQRHVRPVDSATR